MKMGAYACINAPLKKFPSCMFELNYTCILVFLYWLSKHQMKKMNPHACLN